MAVNPYILKDINANLLYPGNDSTYPQSFSSASELAVVPDNMNLGLAGYTKLMGAFTPYTAGMSGSTTSEGARNAGSWWMQTAVWYSYAVRPSGAYFVRSVNFTDELSYYGLVSTLMSTYGYSNIVYMTDQVNDGAVGYETPYGHGVASWPVANTQAQQFRDSTSLPSDGSSRINLTGSAWNRSAYLPSVYYVAHIVQGGTLASGNVKFIVEQRPSYWMTHTYGSHYPYMVKDLDIQGMHPALPYLTYQYILGRVQGRGVNGVRGFEVDDGGVTVNSNVGSTLAKVQTLRKDDPRVREHAIFAINEEYYGMVQGSYILIFSSKQSLVPLVFKDALLTWPSATDPRIAGIAVGSGMSLWVLSGSGELRLLDMSVEGGQWVTKASAPAPAVEEKYGALVLQGTKLWALVGTYTHQPVQESTTTSAVGVIPFDTAAGTWGTRSNSAQPARHNGRSLQEMIPMADGRLAVVAEALTTGVKAPVAIEPYSTQMGTTSEVGGTTMVTKLDARDFHGPAIPRFKLKLGSCTNTSGVNATVKRVPAGSPPGTAFTDSAAITVANGLTNWGDTTLGQLTDWINMPFDPTYDYYVFYNVGSGTSGGNFYRSYGAWPDPVAPNMISTTLPGNLLASTTVPSVTQATNGQKMVLGVVSGEDTYAGNVNPGAGTSNPAFQLMIYNPSNDSWNTTALTSTSSLVVNQSGADGPYWAAQVGLWEVSAGKLLLKGGWKADKLNIFDASGTLDATKFTDVSYGSAKSLFGANAAFSSMVQVQKNVTDGTVLFFPSGQSNSGDTDGYTLGWAPPGFAWDGSEAIQVIDPNPHSGGNVTSFAKDKLSPENLVYYYAQTPWNRLCPLFSDTSAVILTLGELLDGNVYRASYVPRAAGGTYHLPRYFKYSGGQWVIAKNWADAAANPYTVPTTPDTAVPGPAGFVFLFGPATGTTFLTGEYHTINCTHGQVKFARRGRYAFAMFAGRTFHNTETKTLTALRGITPRVYFHHSHTVQPTATGPAGITGNGGFFSWPLMNNGAPNDVPIAVTYDFSLSRPDCDSLIPVMGAGNVALDGSGVTCSASQEYNNADWGAWKAFSRRAMHYGSGQAWQGVSGTTNPWVAVDFGAGKALTALSFSLRMRSLGFAIPKTWKIQGATEGAPTTWVDLGSYVLPNSGSWATCSTTEPFMANIITPGAYRYYRILFVGTYDYPSMAALELYDQALKTTGISFTDIFAIGSGGHHTGMKFEVNAGSGFTEITPKWRSHHGEIFVFDRQTGVTGVRVTSKTGQYSTTEGTRSYNPISFWDYGTQAQIDAARLGSSTAADNTRERGSFDTQCLGVATDAIGVSVDGLSPALYSALWPTSYDDAARGWFTQGPWSVYGKTNKFAVHPYFGFVYLSPNVQGTNVTLSYAWGRRV